MSLLKKFLSSNLSKYEEQQKKRYKKYVKIQKPQARVVEKTEAELYEDIIERQKSLRESKRRAPLPNQELIFKEPTSSGLGPAPAILEATNMYVIVENIPEVYHKDFPHFVPNAKNDSKSDHHNTIFSSENTPRSSDEFTDLPAVPKRKKSRRSLDQQTSVVEIMEDKQQEKIEEFFPVKITNQEMQKHQAIEVGRISISTNSDIFFDCTDSLSHIHDDFDSIISRDITLNKAEPNVIYANENINEIHNVKEKRASFEFEDEEIIYRDKPPESDFMMSRNAIPAKVKPNVIYANEDVIKNQDVTADKWTAFEDEDEQIIYRNKFPSSDVRDSNEIIVKDNITPQKGSFDTLRSDKSSSWHSISSNEETHIWENMKTLQISSQQNKEGNDRNHIGNNHEEIVRVETQKWTPENLITLTTSDQHIVEDNRLPTQENAYESIYQNLQQTQTIPVKNSLEEDSKIDDDVFISSDSDDTLCETFNNYAVLETVTQPSFKVTNERIKFDDFHQDEFFPRTTDEDKDKRFIRFSENSFDNEEEKEGIILDNDESNRQQQNGRHGSSSSEDDVFKMNTNRKVNFDFANSFCTTYEPAAHISSDEASLTSTTTDDDNLRLYNFSIVDNQLYMSVPPAYRDETIYYDKEMYNQRDNVCKNFGIGLEQKEKHSLEPIYENSQTMDVALLNCKNGYKETDITEDEEFDEFSGCESIDFDVRRDRKFQDYYDHIGDFHGEKEKPQIQRQHSICEIEEDLVEIKKLDDVVTQIDRIQDVLNKIQSQIEYLESKDDENYTSLLKTLLNSMKILGNLNCNFDEELLKFQQDTMEHIRTCIKSLNELEK